MPATHATLYRQSGPNIYRRVSDSLFCTAFDSTYCSYCKNKVYRLPGATAPFFAAGVVPLPAAGLGAGFAAALTGALAATGFLGGILKRSVRKLL